MLPSRDQYLTFLIAGEEYAVSVRHVLAIDQFVCARGVPGAPRWIRGVVERDRWVVPVVDLAVKLGSPATEATHRTCVVILETRPANEPLVVGLIVDAVRQVVEVDSGAIRPLPDFGPHVRARYVNGVFDVDGALVVLLDVDRVLLSPDVAWVARLAEATSPADETGADAPAGAA